MNVRFSLSTCRGLGKLRKKLENLIDCKVLIWGIIQQGWEEKFKSSWREGKLVSDPKATIKANKFLLKETHN